MAELHRAFLAVVPPADLLRWAESATNSAASIAPDLRWTRTEQQHLTLQFLGRVDATDRVAEFVADAAVPRAPFTVSLGGGGAFPNARRASVLWLGVQQGSAALVALATSLSSLSNEDRPYRPHLTLARVPKARDLRAAIAALEAHGESDPWTVDEIVLFESRTLASGAVHTEQARFRLAG